VSGTTLLVLRSVDRAVTSVLVRWMTLCRGLSKGSTVVLIRIRLSVPSSTAWIRSDDHELRSRGT
jgi:hypothetical protein